VSRWRDRLKVFVLLPVVVVAVGVLAYFMFRTTLQADSLRQQSILEATLALATEKANRLDRQIIDQDNVIVAIADPARLDELEGRWLPTARRETPTVRAIVVLDESRTVLAFASRASGAFADEEGFRRLLTQRIVFDMDLAGKPPEQLRHLHRACTPGAATSWSPGTTSVASSARRSRRSRAILRAPRTSPRRSPIPRRRAV